MHDHRPGRPMQSRSNRLALPLVAIALALPAFAPAQTPPSPAGAGGQSTAAPRQSGTVKAVTPNDMVLTNAAGQDIAVTLPSTAKILLVDPTTRDVKNAQPGSVSDI